ncbi:MAG: polysaccharide deacetylase family protein [Planctomycetota bacterium]
MSVYTHRGTSVTSTPRDGNLIATYHYVRPCNSDGVTGLTPEAFRRQIESIDARFTVVTAEAFARRSAGGESGLALVTFDDGLRDQFVHAAPILADVGVPAAFFAPMRPMSDEGDGWCTQHLLHALAESLGWCELERLVDARLDADVTIDETRMDELYHYETPRKRRLKYAMAFALEADAAASVLRDINADVGLDHRDWYMLPAELRELARQGHTIGAHGFDHLPYSTLDASEQFDDMLRAHHWLRRILGSDPRAIAFPFGRHDAETDSLAREFGYTLALGTDERTDARDIDDLLAPVPTVASSGRRGGVAA